MPPPDPPPPSPTPGALEVKDAQLTFQAVWDDLTEQHGADNLKFPREFIWLGGAPGAGKGTNTPFIADLRSIDAPPVVISDLLTSPRAVALKNAGRMVGDREVIGLLLDELLKPVYHDGVIVDGFPRTPVQVECLKLFYDRLIGLHDAHRLTPQAREFRTPMFRIALLHVGEEVSVARQIKRGEDIRKHNEQVRQLGIGKPVEERVTDTNRDMCRNRYKTYTNSTHAALESLKKIFHFHFIDAEGPLAEVQRKIEDEFSYQSSLELSHAVFQLVHGIPVAVELARHARQELVERLEEYADGRRELFERVVRFITDKLMPVVKAHAFTGHARFNTEHELFEDPVALRMMIDVLSERGFHTSVDIHKMDVPLRVNPDTWEIVCGTKKVYRIEVRYQPSDIRRGH